MIRYIIILSLLLTACSNEVLMPAPDIDNVSSETKPADGGPYYHNIKYYDGTTSTLLLEHASVPDVLVLEQDVANFSAGTWMIVYVYIAEEPLKTKEGSHVEENIGMMYSTDEGETWSENTILSLYGIDDQIPVDPSLTQLEDGTLLLYYYDFLAQRIYKSGDGERQMHVVESIYGLNYEHVNAVYTRQQSMTDPEVVYYKGLYYMYFTTNEGIHVVSGETPYDFSNEINIEVNGIPGVITVNDTLYLYGCGEVNGKNGITVSSSTDPLSFSVTELVEGPRGCDPAPITLDKLVYKSFMLNNLAE